MKILWPFAVCFAYYGIVIFYSFSTEAAKPFLPGPYSCSDSGVIMIVRIDYMYFCQKRPSWIPKREILIKRLT
jgi:hypothetical protein